MKPSIQPAPSPGKPRTPKPRNRALHFALFLAIFAALDFGYYLTRGTVLEHLFIDTLTVRPAAAVINAVDPPASATAAGSSLLTSFGRINIKEGCEGSEGMFLLIAAILPYPVRWLPRLLGMGSGLALMYAMNQLRILSLVASLHWRPTWFASIHGLIAPTCIVLAGCIFFFAWSSAASSAWSSALTSARSSTVASPAHSRDRV
jgi:exosortase family protein XrtM